jgi:hypothetical protein
MVENFIQVPPNENYLKYVLTGIPPQQTYDNDNAQKDWPDCTGEYPATENLETRSLK